MCAQRTKILSKKSHLYSAFQMLKWCLCCVSFTAWNQSILQIQCECDVMVYGVTFDMIFISVFPQGSFYGYMQPYSILASFFFPIKESFVLQKWENA
jgi:hypothetical protein